MNYWKCKHLYIHNWRENTGRISYSCKYYWLNHHLMKDFLSEYGKLKYYWTYSYEGQVERKRIEGDNSAGLCGVSGPPIDTIRAFDINFHKNYDSRDFPYNFDAYTVCRGCKFFLK